MSEKRPTEFQPVDDPAEAKALLREGAQLTASTTIWPKTQRSAVNTFMTMYSAAEEVLYFAKPKEDAEEFLKELKDPGNRECLFSVSLPNANIFFKANFEKLDTPGLRFEIPKKVFRVQRRSEMRLTIPGDHKIRVDFADPLLPGERLSKDLIDISAAGMAFLATPEEQPMFVKGAHLRDLTFKIRGREMKLEGEVRHSVPLSSKGRSNKGFKIGVAFVNIRPGEQQHIATYVFEECRRLYFRLM